MLDLAFLMAGTAQQNHLNYELKAKATVSDAVGAADASKVGTFSAGVSTNDASSASGAFDRNCIKGKKSTLKS